MTDETPQVDSSTDRVATPENDRSRFAILANHLATRVHPLDTTDPTSDLRDLQPLADILTDANIVGMGEATHGTREFFHLKHRLFEFLVRERGFRVFGLEANFSEALAITDYVLHGEGDPQEALAGIYFWTWDTEEVLALIEWIRTFNEGSDDPIMFYGIDMQFTRGPARALLEYLALDPSGLANHREPLELLAERGLETEPGNVVEDRLLTAEDLVESLRDRFNEPETDYIDVTSCDEYELANQHLRTLEQAVEAARAKYDGDIEVFAAIRDRSMAENVSWILDYESRDRIALWAHNAHVKQVIREDDWGTAPPMGSYLTTEYGDQYYALGFDFAGGTFQALDDSTHSDDGRELRECSLGSPPDDSATRLFAEVDEPVYVLDFDSIADDSSLAEWFADERLIRSLGAIYYGQNETDSHHACDVLPDAFDGLVFVSETSRAIPLDRS
jgi:erythromycin esterase